jgi:hypothetical protein
MRNTERKIDYRELIDLPEKVAIIIGSGFVLIGSAVFPPLVAIGGEMIVGGSLSLGVTENLIPKKNKSF